MGPIYFLSGARASPEKLEELGLGYLLDGGGISVADVPHSGPDGKGGSMFTLPDAAGQCPSVSVLAAVAKFHPLPGSTPSALSPSPPEGEGRGEGCYFGWDPKNPPGPADLARREQFSGHAVRLADGREWLVPAARLYGGGTAFPTKLAWDGSRWARGQVIERYRELFDAAVKYWDLFQVIIADVVAHGHTDITLQDEACTGAQALACNYRIGPGEITLLELFTDQTEVEVIKALIDWPAVEAKAGGVRAGLAAAWHKGLLPDYSPTVAEVAGLAAGAKE